jgi:HEAT repeat protein
MRRSINHLVRATILAHVIASAITSIAQAPPTIEAALHKYGVSTTRLALQSALTDNRPEVRSLAAGELAEMKDSASIPLMVEVLQQEKDTLVRLNMAGSLLSLGSPVGKRVLLNLCNDTLLSESRRLEAGSRLVDVGDTGCLSSVESILAKTGDAPIKVSALLVLARVKVVPGSLAATTHQLLVKTLQDGSSTVRQYSSECLVALGDKAASPNLKAAIGVESDPLTKQHMEAALDLLEGKQ